MRTGLPFHVDGPFFVARRRNKADLVMESTDEKGENIFLIIFFTVKSAGDVFPRNVNRRRWGSFSVFFF